MAVPDGSHAVGAGGSYGRGMDAASSHPSIQHGTSSTVAPEVGWPERLGPMLPGERGFPARMRAHQAWYRSEVLGLPTFGRLQPPSGRWLGSVLDDASAAAGMNFTSKAAQDFFTWRRTQGWGVDPYRCTAVLTSSQVLAINIFGLLRDRRSWGARAVTEALGLPVDEIDAVDIEVGGRLLGHATRVDAVITCSVAGRGATTIGWEVKLCDRFTSRNLALHDPYDQLVASTSMWRTSAVASVTKPINALFRCHALVVAISQRAQTHAGPFVLLRHDEDPLASGVVRTYQQLLTEPASLIDCTLAALLTALRTTADEPDAASLVDVLSQRYIDLHQSEAAWRALEEAGSMEAGAMPGMPLA